MIKYTIVEGDTLQRIAYKFQTTSKQIVLDNPDLKEPLTVGLKINIKTIKEIVQDNIMNAVQSSDKSENKIAVLVANVQYEPSKLSETGDTFAGVTLTQGQEGIVKWIKDGHIYQITANNQLVKKDAVKKGARYRYYQYLDKYGGVYVLNGTNSYAKISEVEKEEVPLATMTSTTMKPPKQIKEDQNKTFTIPQFEMPGYKRTRMKVKKTDGTYLTIELRVMEFVPGYSNQFSPARTNAGWMTNIGGANLTPISITGFFLDTKANMEAREFMEMYKEFFVPKNNVDYFSIEVVSLLHKGWEYQGLIQNFSMPDTAQNPLDRKFQMQFLSFIDKPIAAKEIASKYPDVVSRDKKTEAEFRSDLGKMLTNPLTGKYTKDNS